MPDQPRLQKLLPDLVATLEQLIRRHSPVLAVKLTVCDYLHANSLPGSLPL